jgi:DNA-binding MarR family transcriptional regulator
VPSKKPKKTRQKPRAARVAQAKFLHDHIVGRICRLGDAMIRMSSRHFRKLWNLRHTDVRLLNILDSEEPVPVSEISRRALVDQAWVSRSLRALEAGKLVQRCRDPQDSRLVLFTLTRRGRQVLDEFRPYATWSEKVLLKGVDESTLKALLDQLEANTQSLMDTLEYMPRPSQDGAKPPQ